MCWMAIGIVASLAGTAISAMGQMQAANAQADAQEYQAATQRNNAIIAQRNADDARKRGIVAVDEQQRKTAQLSGRQVAVMSANGVDVTSGSPLDILGDTAQLGAWDASTVKGNFEREALAAETQKMNFNASAELSSAAASNTRSAGPISALGTLASGLGSVAGQWYRYSNGGSSAAVP